MILVAYEFIMMGFAFKNDHRKFEIFGFSGTKIAI